MLAPHAIYPVARGEVVAKAGAGARTISRGESPRYFCCVIVIYAGLALALVFLF